MAPQYFKMEYIKTTMFVQIHWHLLHTNIKWLYTRWLHVIPIITFVRSPINCMIVVLVVQQMESPS